MSKNVSLPVTFSVKNEVSDNDTRFLSVTIDVMHTGVNLNNSNFTKEVVDQCVDTIKNTPVLGFIKYDKVAQEDDFKGHEYILTKTENGIEERYIGSCYGVIPETCNPHWYTKMCEDGIEREFLQVDALLWTKFDKAIGIMERDSEKAQSMELEISSIEGYEDENGIYNFTKFKFDGCCLLGSGCEPAMVSANVKVKEVNFTMSDFIKNLQSEFNDKFTQFTALVNENSNQGGVENMPNTDFAQTLLGMFEDISNLVKEYEVSTDRWGDPVPRYYLADIQENEVIVVDRHNNYNYFGFSFTVNGDKPEIDFSNGVRKKLQYTNYEEGEVIEDKGFNFGKHIEDMESVAFSKVEEANGKVEEINSKFEASKQAKSEAEANYSQVKADYDEIKPKYDEYVLAEEKRQSEELNAQKEAKFAEYADDLADNADFTALKERKDELSVEDIEKECAVLFAKAVRGKKNFSNANQSQVTVEVIDEDVNAGYVVTKYGNIHTGR